MRNGDKLLKKSAFQTKTWLTMSSIEKYLQNPLQALEKNEKTGQTSAKPRTETSTSSGRASFSSLTER